jgi:hypothetical protein
MSTARLSITMAVVGTLGLGMVGCGGASGGKSTGTTSPQSGGAGSGGLPGAGGATGGTTSTAVGSGGVVASGGSSSQIGSGGASASGGAVASGGTTTSTGGIPGRGGATAGTGGAAGSSTPAAGGAPATGGVNAGGSVAIDGGPGAGGGVGNGGRASGGAAAGGATSAGGRTGAGGATAAGGATGTSTGTGTCTASKAAGANASGSGPHKVTVETNADPGISEGTIFRPSDLGGSEKYPIFAWGEGGCSENGLSNSAAMGEIASHGYFVIADGIPNGTASRAQTSNTAMGQPLLAYIAWAIAENGKSCSAYYQSLDTTKIATNGFSCGGLMAEGTAGDSRITTWGLNSSGLFSADQALYKSVHTPVLIVLGGTGDMAYTNGERDYTNIAALGIPIMLFSKALGHGGDLFSTRGGDFTKIDVAWLNWWLKGDEGATGKGVLVGASCTYCSDSAWEVKSANLP